MRDLCPMEAACISHIGNRRPKNEDNFYFGGRYRMENEDGGPVFLVYRLPLFDCSKKLWQFYAVFDGMGGGDYGEVASQTAARAAKIIVENEDIIHSYDITVSLNRMCEKLNEEVFHTAEDFGTDKMGTTLSSFFFYDEKAWVCNLGDSKAFLFRDGKLVQLSEDHTDAEEMERNNITGRKPYITQYLGIDPEEMRIEPYAACYDMGRNDVYLLCSDGLTDMVPKEEIEKILSSDNDVAETARKLLKAALDGGGKDNITIIVIQVS